MVRRGRAGGSTFFLPLVAVLGIGSAAESFAGGPPSYSFDHLQACVRDTDEAQRFLAQSMAWTPKSLPAGPGGRSDVISVDPGGFQLILAGAPCAGKPYEGLYFRVADLDRAVQRLRASGVDVASGEGAQAGRGPLLFPPTLTGGTVIGLVEGKGPAQSPARETLTGKARVDRIALFVSDLERAARFYTDVLGLKRHPEVVTIDGGSNERSGGLKVTFIDARGVWLALVQPVGPGPLQDYLVAQGDGHIAELIVEVDDIAPYYDQQAARGIKLVDTGGHAVDEREKAHVLQPYGDRIAYFPTSDAAGLVIELAQRGPEETSLLHKRDRGWVP